MSHQSPLTWSQHFDRLLSQRLVGSTVRLSGAKLQHLVLPYGADTLLELCAMIIPSPAGAPSRSRTAAAQVAGQGRRRQPLRATSMLSHRAAASPPLVGWLSTSSSAPHGRWKQIRLEIWKEEKSCSFHDLVGEGKAGGGGSGEGGRPEKSAEGGNSFFFRGIGKVLRARYRWVGARREGLGSPVGP